MVDGFNSVFYHYLNCQLIIFTDIIHSWKILMYESTGQHSPIHTTVHTLVAEDNTAAAHTFRVRGILVPLLTSPQIFIIHIYINVFSTSIFKYYIKHVVLKNFSFGWKPDY